MEATRAASSEVWLDVACICAEDTTQSRAELNQEVVADYAEAIERGVVFPSVVVFWDGVDHWLADGFHRVAASRLAGKFKIWAVIHNGSQRDAILHSVGSNQKHGLRRTNADKRHAVGLLLADREWNHWSSNRVAEVCGVSTTFVSRIRAERGEEPGQVRTVKRGAQVYTQVLRAPQISPRERARQRVLYLNLNIDRMVSERDELIAEYGL